MQRLGCDRPINYKTEDLETVLKAEYPQGIDLIFEGVGGRMLEACKRCINPSTGRLVVMGTGVGPGHTFASPPDDAAGRRRGGGGSVGAGTSAARRGNSSCWSLVWNWAALLMLT